MVLVALCSLETVNKRRKRLLNATRVAPFLVVGAWVFSLAAITQSREDTNGDGEEDGGSSFPFRKNTFIYAQDFTGRKNPDFCL